MFTAELISKATEINRSARPQKLNFQKNALPLSFATYMEDRDKIKPNATDGMSVCTWQLPMFLDNWTQLLFWQPFLYFNTVSLLINCFNLQVSQIGIYNSC